MAEESSCHYPNLFGFCAWRHDTLGVLATSFLTQSYFFAVPIIWVSSLWVQITDDRGIFYPGTYYITFSKCEQNRGHLFNTRNNSSVFSGSISMSFKVRAALSWSIVRRITVPFISKAFRCSESTLDCCLRLYFRCQILLGANSELCSPEFISIGFFLE